MHRVVRLDPSAVAPAQARRAVRDVAFPVVNGEVADTAELLASELVTNAVMHGTGFVTLAIDRCEQTLEVSVGDDSPGIPQVQPERPLSLGGRGLRMVAALAGEWGVKPRGDGPGKMVWFRLP